MRRAWSAIERVLRVALLAITLLLAWNLAFPPLSKQDAVPLELRPGYSLLMEFGDRKVTRAVVSLCGPATGQTCEEARTLLRRVAAQCPNVFLGTIDRAQHSWVPLHYYDAPDHKLILFREIGFEKTPTRINVSMRVTPYVVGALMCPDQSMSLLLYLIGLLPF